MKAHRLFKLLLVLATMSLAAFASTANAGDGGMEKFITSGMCTTINLTDIPVVERLVENMQQPFSPHEVSQGYDTSYDEGYSSNGKWLYGHDGLDLVNSSHTPGINDITSVQDGFVVMSLGQDDSHKWGETIVIATRANAFSDEIITYHYHHMHYDTSTNKTSRKFNACETVNTGDVIGKEGNTGNVTGTHLHFGIRRWKNLKELKKAMQSGVLAVLGYGYTFGDDSKIAKNLDPEGVLEDTFSDYQFGGNLPDYAWSLPYVLDVRHRGIEFGLFDGRYGAGQNVTRREAARWLKIAARQYDAVPALPTFTDVPAADSDEPYIEALAVYPSRYPVINRDASVIGGLRYFHPDDPVTRAQALKMVILSFHSAEFLELYDNFIWKAQKAAATQLLGQFQDVNPGDWYAPFVYYGAQKGLVQVQSDFYPNNPIKREEIAKWISEGARQIDDEALGPCSYLSCPEGFFCDPATSQCYEVPACIPSETNVCPAGGGYEGGDQGTGGSAGSGNSTGSGGTASSGGTGGGAGSSGSGNNDPCGGYCGPGTLCDIQTGTCYLDTSGSGGSSGSGGTPGSSGSGGSGGSGGSSGNGSGSGTGGSPPVCSAGQTAVCGNCGTATCNQNGQWSSCLNQGVCPPGQTQNQSCNTNGTQTRTCQSSCFWSGWSTCSVPPQQQCQDVFLASSSPACYTNPNGPTLCIAVQQVSGSTWKYNVCKQGGSFSNSYKTILTDDNHTPQLGDTYTGNSGDTCTPWRTFSVSYISGYGSVNGAGVRARSSRRLRVPSLRVCIRPAP